MFSLTFHGCFNNDMAGMARLAFQDGSARGLEFRVSIEYLCKAANYILEVLTVQLLLSGVVGSAAFRGI